MVTEKEYKKFLEERNLTRAFHTYQGLKGQKKVVIQHNFNLFNGGGKKAARIQLNRSKYGIIIRDYETLHVIGKSRSKDFSSVIRKINTTVKVKGSARGQEYEIKRPALKLKERYDLGSYNESLKRLRVHTYSNTPVRRMGHVVADVILIKDGRKQRIQAHSSGGVDLKKKSEVNAAIEEAIGNAFAAAGYTPDEWYLVDWWYGSYRDYNDTRPRR